MPDSTKPQYPWWEFLVPGVLLMLGSIYAWWYLAEMERQPGVVRLPSAAVILYQWGGKWAVALFVAGVGALFSAIGTWKLTRKLRERQPPDDAPA